MKKIIVILLTGLALAGLCGCNDKKNENENVDTNEEVIVDLYMVNKYIDKEYGEEFYAEDFEEIEDDYIEFMVYDGDDNVSRYVTIEKDFLDMLTRE